MAIPRIRFVSWREQPDGSIRPRFQPGPRERHLGFVGEDLKHATAGGAWFTFEEVRAYMLGPDGTSGKLAELKAVRAGGRAKRPPKAARAHTVEALLEDWLRSDRVKSLAAKTRDGYRKQVNAVLYKPRATRNEALALEALARAPVQAIGTPELQTFFEYQKRERGLHMARASIAVISAAWSWGRTSTFWRLGVNPRDGLSLEQPEGRIVIYSDAEIRALVAAADALDRPSIGDAILLGLFTGQRQGDRLALADKGLVEGRRRFKQSKTDAIVAIPETPQLKARLEAARKRVAELAIGMPADKRPSTVIVDETTRREWNEHTYRHEFARIRAAAIAGVPDQAMMALELRNDPAPAWLVEPCPSLDGKRDQDLRDTAVTWLARAGCTLPEIASITGHSLRSIHQILQHYLAITPELADSAIAKLVAWMEKERMVV